MKTTIALDVETKSHLDQIVENKRDTYDIILERLLAAYDEHQHCRRRSKATRQEVARVTEE